MWGRPVNLATYRKSVSESELDYAASEEVEPEIDEEPLLISYDGEEYSESELSDTVAEEIMMDEVSYNTRASEWYE